MTNKSVVHKGLPPSEQKFHEAFTDRLRKMRRLFDSEKAFAKALGLTTVGLSKIYAGGLTSPKRMFDALLVDESILDDICALYGRKLVPNDSSEEESAAPPLVAALHEVIDAEKDGHKDDNEILKMDCALARAEKTIGGLRARARIIRERRAQLAALDAEALA